MTTIDERFPGVQAGLDEEALLERYGRPGAALPPGERPWIRVNFVSTLDGAATGRDGLSGSISSETDSAVFAVLRCLADAVLVGAGTVRREGYEGELVDGAQRTRRRALGLAEHPGLVIASRRLDLDPASPLFTDSPVRPLIATVAAAPSAQRAALEAVADVVDCGEDELEPVRLRGELAARGWSDILCEGGPSLFSTLAAAEAVDELCLTLEPRLVLGQGPRIASGPTAAVGLRLAHVLRGDGDELLLRLVRDRP